MIRSIFMAIVLVFTVSGTALAEGTETTAAKCVQSALNDILEEKGAGAVDGQPGKMTRDALSRIKSVLNTTFLDNVSPVNKGNSVGYCLHIVNSDYTGSAHDGVTFSEETLAFYEKVANDAVVKITFAMKGNGSEDVKFYLAFKDKLEKKIIQLEQEEMSKNDSVWTITVPYESVKDSASFYVYFTEGWQLSSGGSYFFTTDPLELMVFGGGLYYEYDVQKK